MLFRSRIQEYSLLQAIEYGAQGYFPNGTHPVACLFVEMEPSLVDFNIHPAKREARFKDISSLHHGVSSRVRDFLKEYTKKEIIDGAKNEEETFFSQNDTFNFDAPSAKYMGYTERLRHSYSGNSGKRESFFGTSASNSKSNASALASVLIDAGIEGRETKPNYVSSPETDVKEDNFHFVGMALGTFLIAEKDDVLYIIDQHAAHERVLYNKIMNDAGQKQSLLVPYVVQTESAGDDNFLSELQEALEACGFTGKNCGNGRWEFYTVPIRWKGTEEDLKKDLLDKRINPKDMINAVAASTACRSAVMDGTVLDEKTASWIAQEALKLPDPHCPHGRPVYTTITRKQLFSLVKRI